MKAIFVSAKLFRSTGPSKSDRELVREIADVEFSVPQTGVEFDEQWGSELFFAKCMKGNGITVDAQTWLRARMEDKVSEKQIRAMALDWLPEVGRERLSASERIVRYVDRGKATVADLERAISELRGEETEEEREVS
jgi:hypothetical protein